MKTISRILMLAVLMLAVTSMYAQKDENPFKKKIQAYNNQIVKATLAGDHEKSLSFYTKDVLSLPNYGEAMKGLEEISAHQREAEEMGNKITAMKLTTKKVEEHGDALIEVGVYTITIETKAMPQPINDEGKYLTVWEKQKDGTYKIAYEIWNTNTSPMEMMKKGDAKGSGELDPNIEKKKKLSQEEGGTTKSESEKKKN